MCAMYNSIEANQNIYCLKHHVFVLRTFNILSVSYFKCIVVVIEVFLLC